jgi:hypothetical protein
MKLLELLPSLATYTRIKRQSWDFVLIRSEYLDYPLIKLNVFILQMEKYTLTYADLIADDWMIVE